MSVSELHSTPDRHVRLVAVTLEVHAVADDGTELEPIRMQPITVNAGDWKTFDLVGVLAQVENEINEKS